MITSGRANSESGNVRAPRVSASPFQTLCSTRVYARVPRRGPLPGQLIMKERVTPDGRYFVVRGRLWRRANPNLPPERREVLVRELMAARRAVKVALKSAKPEALALARKSVDEAKIALGERGPVWWDDGTPDLNRHKVKDSPYAEWYQAKGDT